MGQALKDGIRQWNNIAVFGDYLPWVVHKNNGGEKANYPIHSGKILDLKDGHESAVTHFADMIAPQLEPDCVIVTVPSHDPSRTKTGLTSLATKLAKDGRQDGAGILVRKKKIEKLAHGGDRSETVHLESIEVARPDLIKGKVVLLLDDVTKTGNSLEACRKLLIQAGAKAVECATIGKT